MKTYPYIAIQLIDGKIKVVCNERENIHETLLLSWKANHKVFEFANYNERNKTYCELVNITGSLEFDDKLKQGIEVTCIEIKNGLAYFKEENNKMEKTAMQLLKERLFDVKIRQNPITYDEINGFIELEKKQIIEAYDEGYNNGIRNNKHTSEQYYNNKFNK